ncbi:MAG: uracil phosphoribosyltransferase [Bdellovibrionaceae bacterium]|nr:uracil phosphoribosyltransferase [Pseudobdellovibrionaceae bacterium]NUM60475.1 uracil phosphoribosyltransferase [Pseudobdellovibrionaceae bacterium]
MDHYYGPNVHLLDKPSLTSILANLCSPTTYQPQINTYVNYLYSQLLSEVVNDHFDTEVHYIETRMSKDHPQSLLKATKIKNQKAVCINLARAGTFPSHLCYEQLHLFLSQDNIRQDHIFAARMTNDNYQVTSTQLDGFKIGGDINDAIVLIPDPMGATGTTVVSTIEHYKKKVPGKAKKFIAIHLIVTPEYLKKISTFHPDVHIYTLRVDRGLSTKEIQEAPPGKYWDQEKGLNSKDYIVPGAGGFGEIMNNSFV